eukprot:2076980-Rhodomonas_salina.1
MRYVLRRHTRSHPNANATAHAHTLSARFVPGIRRRVPDSGVYGAYFRSRIGRLRWPYPPLPPGTAQASTLRYDPRPIVWATKYNEQVSPSQPLPALTLSPHSAFTLSALTLSPHSAFTLSDLTLSGLIAGARGGRAAGQSGHQETMNPHPPTMTAHPQTMTTRPQTMTPHSTTFLLGHIASETKAIFPSAEDPAAAAEKAAREINGKRPKLPYTL